MKISFMAADNFGVALRLLRGFNKNNECCLKELIDESAGGDSCLPLDFVLFFFS